LDQLQLKQHYYCNYM